MHESRSRHIPIKSSYEQASGDSMIPRQCAVAVGRSLSADAR
jgi:hypothetical protein